VYRDEVRGELRYELSCPSRMGVDGYVDGWVERIIFPTVPFDTDELASFTVDDGGKTPEITVEIKKIG
jgi:hypothetical protein